MKLKRKNKIIKIFIFLILIFCLKTYTSLASEKNKIKISKDVSERIDQYLENKIFSYVYDNTIYNTTKIAVAISEDGLSSVLGYCREKLELCRTNSPYLFQIKKRCERISNKKCEIIIKGDFLFINKNKIKLNKENKEIYFLVQKNTLEKKQQSDFEVDNSKDYESDWNS